MSTICLGLVHKDHDSDYGISFPDAPGCISAGETMEELMTMGHEALNFHLDMLARDGDPIPSPRTYEQSLQDPQFVEDSADAVILVPIERERMLEAAQ